MVVLALLVLFGGMFVFSILGVISDILIPWAIYLYCKIMHKELPKDMFEED